MSEKCGLPNYGEATKCRPSNAPPSYTPVDPFGQQQQQQPVVIVHAKSGLFHKGARFNEFAKPNVPPPPPGCPPNQVQQVLMEKGTVDVVL